MSGGPRDTEIAQHLIVQRMIGQFGRQSQAAGIGRSVRRMGAASLPDRLDQIAEPQAAFPDRDHGIGRDPPLQWDLIEDARRPLFQFDIQQRLSLIHI